MRYFESEAEFKLYVDRLNALISHDYSHWQSTEARKKHVDMHGVQIQEGEIYFKRQYGTAYDDVLKLSRLSMERLLFALFVSNYNLESFADKMIDQQRKALLDGL